MTLDSSNTIQVNQNLARLLRLHGEPFQDLLQGTAFDFREGETPAGFAADLEVPAQIQDMVARIIELRNIETCPESFSEQQEQLEQINSHFERVLKEEAMLLDDESFKIFDKHLSVELLSRSVEHLDSLPSFEETVESGASKGLLADMRVSVRRQIHLARFLQSASSLTEERGEIAQIMAANFFHDAVSHMCLIREVLDYHSGNYDESEGQDLVDLEHVLDLQKSFVLQTLRGNIAIATDTYELSSFDSVREFSPSLRLVANRFELPLKINGESILRGKGEATLSFEVGESAGLYGDSAALALVIYNLVKNPIKKAFLSLQEVPSVSISVEPSTDGRCASIFVRDEGLGFSVDDLRKKFTGEAFRKLQEGGALNFFEECLVDEAWQEHIPFAVYGQLLCNRGATTGGGTGIGLQLAKEIIEEGHNGAFRLYNHPKLGAGVQILLPNREVGDDPIQRRQAVLGSLQHQLEHGLKESLS